MRFLEAVLLVPLFCFLAWATQMDLILPYDMDGIIERICTPLWGIPLGILAVGIVLLRLICRRGGKDYLKSGKVLKAVQILTAAAVIGAAAVFAV